MAGSLVDTNVLLDIATADPVWKPWSAGQVVSALKRGFVFTNPVIYAELAPAFPSKEKLDEWLNDRFFQKLELPYDVAWVAGQAFKKYRTAGGNKLSPLPDFFIGAHAQLLSVPLITRDPKKFRTYFPDVQLIKPE